MNATDYLSLDDFNFECFVLELELFLIVTTTAWLTFGQVDSFNKAS